MYLRVPHMKPGQRVTAIIEREDDEVVALCPELDVASQGASIEEARTNLVEALTLFFEAAIAVGVSPPFPRRREQKPDRLKTIWEYTKFPWRCSVSLW